MTKRGLVEVKDSSSPATSGSQSLSTLSRSCMALSGVQVVLDDQAAGHRAAHQGAGDQAEGGGRQSGHVGAGRSAGFTSSGP